MTTVRKYIIGPGDYFELSLPQFSKCVSVHVQNNEFCMYVLIKDDSHKKQRKFLMVNADQHIKEDMRNLTFIDTCQLASLVFHFFELFE